MSTYYGEAHGKLIITGEHAVVHGCPALAMATERTASASILPWHDDRFMYSCAAFDETADLPFDEVVTTYRQAVARHERFLAGELTIDEVLPRKQDLVVCAAGQMFDLYGTPSRGLALELYVDIPLGCGMGSSAAVATAVIRAVAAMQGQDLSNDDVYDAALRCEQLIHGRPSGVDVYVAVYGGWTRFQDGAAEPLPGSPPAVQVINTGRPASGTGECVDHVRVLDVPDSLWAEFRHAAAAIETAVTQDDTEALICGVRKNHRLLCQIGVVPERVQRFVEAVEEQGGAGKISGAGSIKGDAAGVVLVFGGVDLCSQLTAFGYTQL
ncbi:MAG: mevalonate kinase family protein [Planctomycetota bacterium]|jgi:hydroxymethylglutaryl-CoA synthase